MFNSNSIQATCRTRELLILELHKQFVAPTHVHNYLLTIFSNNTIQNAKLYVGWYIYVSKAGYDQPESSAW